MPNEQDELGATLRDEQTNAHLKNNSPAPRTNSQMVDSEQALKVPESFSPIPSAHAVSNILSLAVLEKEYSGLLKVNYAHIAIALIRESGKVHRLEAFDQRSELQRLNILLGGHATRINEFIVIDQCQEVLQISWNIAQQLHSNQVEFEHVALAVILFGGADFASAVKASSKIELQNLQLQLEYCAARLAEKSSIVPELFLDEDKLRKICKGEELAEEIIISEISYVDEVSRWLSYASKRIIALAGAYARENDRHEIDVEMLIMALGTCNTSNAWKALKACGLVLRHNDPEILKRGKSRRASKLQLAPNAQSIMHGAIELAHSQKKDLVAPEHILQAIINECNGYSQLALQIFDLDALELNQILREIMNDNP